VIVEEGQVVPADARLICDYDNPDAFAEYQEMHLVEDDSPTEKRAIEDEDADGDDEPKHHGVAIVACDQSAITGESLAVDKFMVRFLADPRRLDSNCLG
jgi:H+-transporting ATPase